MSSVYCWRWKFTYPKFVSWSDHHALEILLAYMVCGSTYYLRRTRFHSLRIIQSWHQKFHSNTSTCSWSLLLNVKKILDSSKVLTEKSFSFVDLLVIDKYKKLVHLKFLSVNMGVPQGSALSLYTILSSYDRYLEIFTFSNIYTHNSMFNYMSHK